MPKNGISPESLRANQKLLERLKTSRLSELKLDDVEPFSTQDKDLEPLANELVSYIVDFALGPDQPVTVTVPQFNKVYKWSGSQGVCAKRASPLGDWFNDLPQQSCLEMVSSSVLARVNALNKVVRISVRAPGDVVAIFDKVPVEPITREKNAAGQGTMIESFADCIGASGRKPTKATDDCGWSPRYVGQCAAGKEINLKLGSVQAGSPSVLVRVCAGIHGCNYAKYGTGDDRRRYIQNIVNGELDSTGDSIEFTCPSNGPYEYVHGGDAVKMVGYGYFSVMTSAPGADVIFDGSGDVKYPAREEDVFRYQEGAFYGDVFGSVAAVHSGKVLFGNQYACYAPNWGEGVAKLADRLCAVPHPTDVQIDNCFVNAPKSCWDSVCDMAIAGHHRAYAWCREGELRWNYPITVYLNHPCDLSSDAACSSLTRWPLIDDRG
jgi:hypothetical protein